MKTENNVRYIHRQISIFAEDNTNMIDGTCGNGNDTLYLANKYPNSTIIGFDIQQQAIENTNKRCENCTNVELHLDSHANVKKYVNDNVSLAIFNLGYLPRADETVTTLASSTITAINEILTILNEGGAIVITLYRGESNLAETEEVLKYLKTIDKDFFIVSMYDLINLKNNPFNVIIERK